MSHFFLCLFEREPVAYFEELLQSVLQQYPMTLMAVRNQIQSGPQTIRVMVQK